jgi:fibronectin-binding autotransporter adhesin
MIFRFAAKDRRNGEPRRAEDQRRRRLRPTLLALEERMLLSTIVVNNPTDTPVTDKVDLRQAIDMAKTDGGNEAITFDGTVFGTAQTITLASGPLEVGDTTGTETIAGPGAGALTIDAGGKSRVFAIDPGVTASISGLTVTGGASGGAYVSGGDVLNQGTLTLTGVTLSGGSAYSGGGLSNSGTATLVDSTIADNIGNRGAGMFNGGTVTLEDCTVAGNTGAPAGGIESVSLGGGLFNWGSLTMIGGSITGDTANVGSAVYSGYGTVTNLKGTTIQDNPNAGYPGSNEMIYNRGGSMSLADCTISGDSSAPVFGFGIKNYYYGQLHLTDCTVEGFSNGGIINENSSSLSMSGCQIINNAGKGGLVNEQYGNATLTDCIISGNTMSGEGFEHRYGGGGVTNLGGATLAMTDCLVDGNQDVATPGQHLDSYGGGIFNEGTVTLTGCTLNDNMASGPGGALFNGGQATLTGCTVSGNSSLQGAGIDNHSGQYYTAKTTLTDTIVAGNTTGVGDVASDIGGSDPSDVTGSYNLIGTGGSGGLTSADHNLLNVANPGLAPLGDYGGPTETIALQPNSPAIHAGTAISVLTTDQRGFALDNPPDIGAFQAQPGPLVVDTAIDGLGSDIGQLSLRQAVNLADVLDGGATITFDKAAFSAPTVIDLTAGQLELSNTSGPINILGTGLGKMAISGAGSSRVFQVDKGASASLSGLTITGGVTSGDGGGLLNQGTVVLSGDAIVGNSAADGGGVANLGTAVTLGTAINGNAALSDGGGVFNTGSLSMSLSDLSANRAETDGGGLYNSGTAGLVLCAVDSNSASAGGGIYADASGQPVVLIGTEVKRNKGGNIFGRVIDLF